MIENTKAGIAPEKKEPEKKSPEIIRFEEIEKEVKKAIEAKDIERVLLLGELTLARNIHGKNVTKKDFSICFAAFVSGGNVIKRAGVYANTGANKVSQEEAEDILLAQDFGNMKVLAIPRKSVFAELFK